MASGKIGTVELIRKQVLGSVEGRREDLIKILLSANPGSGIVKRNAMHICSRWNFEQVFKRMD